MGMWLIEHFYYLSTVLFVHSIFSCKQPLRLHERHWKLIGVAESSEFVWLGYEAIKYLRVLKLREHRRARYNKGGPIDLSHFCWRRVILKYSDQWAIRGTRLTGPTALRSLMRIRFLNQPLSSGQEKPFACFWQARCYPYAATNLFTLNGLQY